MRTIVGCSVAFGRPGPVLRLGTAVGCGAVILLRVLSGGRRPRLQRFTVRVERYVVDAVGVEVDRLVADLSALGVDPDDLAVVVDGVEGVAATAWPGHPHDGGGTVTRLIEVPGDAVVGVGMVVAGPRVRSSCPTRHVVEGVVLR